MTRLKTKHMYYAMLLVVVVSFVSWLFGYEVIHYYKFTTPVVEQEWGKVRGFVSTSTTKTGSYTIEGSPYALAISFHYADSTVLEGTVTMHSMALRNTETSIAVLKDSQHQKGFKHGVEGTFVYFKYGLPMLSGTIDMEHVPHTLTMEYTIKTKAGESTHSLELQFEPEYHEERHFIVWDTIMSV